MFSGIVAHVNGLQVLQFLLHAFLLIVDLDGDIFALEVVPERLELGFLYTVEQDTGIAALALQLQVEQFGPSRGTQEEGLGNVVEAQVEHGLGGKNQRFLQRENEAFLGFDRATNAGLIKGTSII